MFFLPGSIASSPDTAPLPRLSTGVGCLTGVVVVAFVRRGSGVGGGLESRFWVNTPRRHTADEGSRRTIQSQGSTGAWAARR